MMKMISHSDFQTLPWVCKEMVMMLPIGISSVLEPTPGRGNLVKTLRDHQYQVTAPKDFWKITGCFDAVVMNPPFTPMVLGYRILFAVMEMSDVIIALMPWLTLINSEGRIKALRHFGLKSVTHLPRSVFPGTRVQTCILNLQKGYRGQTIMQFLEQGSSDVACAIDDAGDIPIAPVCFR